VHETSARAQIEEPDEESIRRGASTDSREDIARTLVHSARFVRPMIVVSNQMQEAMHEKEIQLQREADVNARRLPRSGIGRDDHLAKQA
jgi:hypothetical protein